MKLGKMPLIVGGVVLLGAVAAMAGGTAKAADKPAKPEPQPQPQPQPRPKPEPEPEPDPEDDPEVDPEDDPEEEVNPADPGENWSFDPDPKPEGGMGSHLDDPGLEQYFDPEETPPAPGMGSHLDDPELGQYFDPEPGGELAEGPGAQGTGESWDYQQEGNTPADASIAEMAPTGEDGSPWGFSLSDFASSDESTDDSAGEVIPPGFGNGQANGFDNLTYRPDLAQLDAEDDAFTRWIRSILQSQKAITDHARLLASFPSHGCDSVSPACVPRFQCLPQR